jgi:uncharacterized protein YeaO (DUF488 family)
MPVAIKRVYEPPSLKDGERVLVDRLWPRGLTKTRAALDEWLRDLAPSDDCGAGTMPAQISGRTSASGI